jgi:F-type H+-transporting ATPase subunit b
MKILCFSGRHRWPAMHLILAIVVAMLLVFSVGTAISSASGEQESAEEAVHDSEALAEQAVEHAEAGAHGKGWVPTDTFRLLHFIVLAGALFFLLKKPVSQALAGRVKGIEAQLGDLENQKKEAEQKLSEYNQKFAQLEKESASIMAEYVRQGEEAKVRILKEAESAAEKMKAQAQKNIESEIQRAKAQLQEEILDQALAKAEALIKEKINTDDQEQLVDEYLAKVVAS